MAEALRLEIIVDDKGTATMKQFAGAVEQVAEPLKHTAAAAHETESSFSELFATGAKLALGFNTMEGALEALKELFVHAVESASEYGLALEHIQTIGHLSAEGLEAVRSAIEQIDPALGNSTQLAEAYVLALRSTGDVSKALEETTQAAILQKATTSDLSTSINVLAETMAAFGLHESDA